MCGISIILAIVTALVGSADAIKAWKKVTTNVYIRLITTTVSDLPVTPSFTFLDTISRYHFLLPIATVPTTATAFATSSVIHTISNSDFWFPDFTRYLHFYDTIDLPTSLLTQTINHNEETSSRARAISALDRTTTEYFQLSTFTPPSYCIDKFSTNWNILGTALIGELPIYVHDQLTPITTFGPITTNSEWYGSKITHVKVAYILSQSAVPPVHFIGYRPTLDYQEQEAACKKPSKMSEVDDSEYIHAIYIAQTPTATPESPYERQDRLNKEIEFRQTMIMTIIPTVSILVLGLIENWWNFVRLMKGKKAERGVPWLWVAGIFLLVVFTSWEGKVKNEAQKKRMREYWKKLRGREKVRLWLRWGWTKKYPDFLNEVRGVPLMGEEVGMRDLGNVSTPPPEYHNFDTPPPYRE